MMPDAIFVPVEDLDLSINRACRAAVAVGVECYRLDKVLVSMLHIEVEPRLFFSDRRYVVVKRRHLASLKGG